MQGKRAQSHLDLFCAFKVLSPVIENLKYLFIYYTIIPLITPAKSVSFFTEVLLQYQKEYLCHHMKYWYL